MLSPLLYISFLIFQYSVPCIEFLGFVLCFLLLVFSVCFFVVGGVHNLSTTVVHPILGMEALCAFFAKLFYSNK